MTSGADGKGRHASARGGGVHTAKIADNFAIQLGERHIVRADGE
jgi:hypothetical protein